MADSQGEKVQARCQFESSQISHALACSSPDCSAGTVAVAPLVSPLKMTSGLSYAFTVWMRQVPYDSILLASVLV